ISPRKLRLVADAIRSLSPQEAARVLLAAEKRAASPIFKTLKSAMANAVNNSKLDEKNLIIKNIIVEDGQALKRFHPSSRGRTHPYKKRSSHIKVILTEKEAKVQPVAKVNKNEVKKSAGAKAVANKGGKK